MVTASSTSAKSALVALAALVVYVWVMNAWVADDAYITFRTVDNFLGGYGLTWNPAERVQAYTHPLWMFLVSALTVVTGDPFRASMIAGASATLGAIAIGAAVLTRGGSLIRVVFVLLLLSSKAFVDYSSSGLENPLTYLLLALLARVLLDDSAPLSDRRALRAILIVSLLFVNRFDALLLALPALVYAIGSYLRASADRRWTVRLRQLALAGAPAWGWLSFATVYYGFPLPNTAYAKLATGLPLGDRLVQGLHYYANSLRYDGLTLTVIVAGIASGIVRRKVDRRSFRIAVGLCLSLVYILWIGGDFMSGRFFAAPFFLAAILLCLALGAAHDLAAESRWRRLILPSIAPALVAINLFMPGAPIKSDVHYERLWRIKDHHGITDERGYYFPSSSLLRSFDERLEVYPNTRRYAAGLALRDGDEKVVFRAYVGHLGYAAGPGVHIIDRMGLAEPLLARLPAKGRRIGHFRRNMPKGLLESVEADENRIADPVLRDYYGKIRRVTRGSLWGLDRFRAMLYLNLVRRSIAEWHGEVEAVPDPEEGI